MDTTPLVEALRDATLVAFIGAGASRSFKDPSTGAEFPGLPTASEIVGKLRATRPKLIGPDNTFGQACFLIQESDGRPALEKFLQGELDQPTRKPLPAHTLTANLPFAAYITTNFDKLLEKALTTARQTYHVIINDDDVTTLRKDMVPVVKLHGCVSRPASLIASEDQAMPLSVKAPIIEAFLKALLASKSIVFLGFSLQDIDFKLLYNEVHRMLGPRMPRSYAVVKNPSTFDAQYWQKKGIHIIDEDLTILLRDLIKDFTEASTRTGQRRAVHPDDEWLRNPFFSSLLNFRSLPSETQVIDAFLNHLLNELRIPSQSLTDAIAKSRVAKDLVVQHRPNFVALKELGTTLIDEIESKSGNDKDVAEKKINEVINRRLLIGLGIKQKADQVIHKGNRILTYSQSVRVLELLRGASQGIQDQCHVFIAECRPKSPEAFRDAIAIAEGLKGTGYKITLIPDVAAGNLIDRNNIDIVLMGAHAVYHDGGAARFFVNTCGSSLVLSAAKAKGIPVFIIAESSKHVTLHGGAGPAISYQEEESLLGREVSGLIADLNAAGLLVSTSNIGYDLCEVGGNVQFVNEL